MRRIRCHVKKKHVRKKKHVCHDCTCLVQCAIMIWTDEQGSHEINRIIVKAIFKQQLLRSIFTSALSSCVIVSVVCLHSSALIHNCRCQCVLCMITTGSRGAFVCRYSAFFSGRRDRDACHQNQNHNSSFCPFQIILARLGQRCCGAFLNVLNLNMFFVMKWSMFDSILFWCFLKHIELEYVSFFMKWSVVDFILL